MTKNYSAAALLQFMDYLKEKGLLKANTAQSRKAAAKKMLEILQDDEKEDLRQIDVDHVHERFANISGTDYTPNSLQVYKSRFKSALDDFISYVDNPVGFKPSVSQREVPSKGSGQSPAAGGKKNNQPKRADPPPLGTIVFPVPIRPDLTVELHNIPSNLTETEADRIAAVVKALAQK